jgi:lysophospholipase L1-like esterase
VTRATGEGCTRKVSLLFLGDSFMEGYDDAHTLPNRVAENLLRDHRICSMAYNAGQTSYSPAIFIPLARKLVPAIRPDYVVIDIDETDLVDDVYRYEPLVVHDAQGGVDRVKVSPPLYALHAGLIEMRRHWFYLQRLVGKLWLTQVTVPRLLRERVVPDGFLASHDRSADLEARHARELAIFERNLKQLIEVILPSMASADRIIFINHPHLEHLQSDAQGPIFNDLIRRTVRKVATAHGAAFFDATPELTQRFAGKPQDFYWNGDMHFTFPGLDLYAEAVAGFLAGRLR